MATIEGTIGNDTLTGTAPDDTLRAGTGNDILIAHGNEDYVLRNDVLVYANTVTVYDGGEGTDYLLVNRDRVGFDQLASFVSIEVVSFERLPASQAGSFVPRAQLGVASEAARTLPSDLLLDGYGQMVIALAAGESFDASAYRRAPFSDVHLYFFSNSAGGSGIGSSGIDFFIGNDGHDNFFGGDGADSMGGKEGNDHLYGRGPTGGPDGADTLYGQGGSDYLQGNAGNDSLDGGTGSDRINGGADNDQIAAGEGNDSVNGNLGDDMIAGDAGNDSLRGGQGNDSISGSEGDDMLSGDLGQDGLRGGTGRDSFVFSGQASPLANPDIITDFDPHQDQLVLGFTPAAMLTGASQPNLATAAILAQQLFDGRAGDREIASIGVGNDRYIFYSSSGGGTIDSAILILGPDFVIEGTSDFAEAS
jgi:serralysin